jgi:thioester reductase-like protein
VEPGPAYRLALPREETALTYFVTGATGFIGRHLVQELLSNREGDVFALVREGSQERLAELAEGWAGGTRVTPVVGDLTQTRGGSKRIAARSTTSSTSPRSTT